VDIMHEGSQPQRGNAMASERFRATFAKIVLDYANIALVLIKGLFMVPFYLHHFPLSTYGAWLATGNALAMLGIAEGGFTLVLAQRLSLSAGARRQREFAIETFCGGAVLLVIALATATVSVALSSRLARLTQISELESARLANAVALGGVALGVSFVQAFLTTIWDAWQRPQIGGIARIIGQCVEISVTFASLRSGHGVVAIPLGSAFGAVVVCAITSLSLGPEWRARNLPRPTFSRDVTLQLARDTFPSFGSKIGNVAVSNSESLIAASLFGPESAAILGLTDRLFKMGQMVVNVAGASIYVAISHLRGEVGKAHALDNAVRRTLSLGSVGVALVLGLLIIANEAFVSAWVGPSRFGGAALSAALGLASATAVRANLFGLMLSAAGGVRESAFCQLAELLLRLPVLFALLRTSGLLGFPLATLATTSTVLILLYSFGLLRVFDRPAQLSRALAVSATGAAPFLTLVAVATITSVSLAPPSGWASFVYRTVGGLAALGIIASIWALSSDVIVHPRIRRNWQALLTGRRR
jgi:O-antigen/teichoic acid export membrane protein